MSQKLNIITPSECKPGCVYARNGKRFLYIGECSCGGLGEDYEIEEPEVAQWCETTKKHVLINIKTPDYYISNWDKFDSATLEQQINKLLIAKKKRGDIEVLFQKKFKAFDKEVLKIKEQDLSWIRKNFKVANCTDTVLWSNAWNEIKPKPSIHSYFNNSPTLPFYNLVSGNQLSNNQIIGNQLLRLHSPWRFHQFAQPCSEDRYEIIEKAIELWHKEGRNWFFDSIIWTN